VEDGVEHLLEVKALYTGCEALLVHGVYAFCAGQRHGSAFYVLVIRSYLTGVRYCRMQPKTSVDALHAFK